MKKTIYLLLMFAALLVYSGTSFAFGSLPDGWFDGKPVTPPEVVPPVQPPPEVKPPPVTPPQTATTEHGTRQSYSTEVNWHFAHPIAFYNKFDLFVGGQKYVVSMAYKDSQIEVRNSQTTGKLVVIAPASFRDKAAHISYPSTGAPTPPPVTPPPAEPVDYSKDFAHMNPCSWMNDGGVGCMGMTLITCPDIPKYDSVSFITDAGKTIPFHFHMMDRGRQQWTNYKWQGKVETRQAGYFLAKRWAQSWKFRMEKPNGTYADNTGKCYRQYR